jgi:hypothetical protein
MIWSPRKRWRWRGYKTDGEVLEGEDEKKGT